jgi:hypothetical protein
MGMEALRNFEALLSKLEERYRIVVTNADVVGLKRHRSAQYDDVVHNSYNDSLNHWFPLVFISEGRKHDHVSKSDALDRG